MPPTGDPFLHSASRLQARNPRTLVALSAVVILLLAILGAIYWPRLFSSPSSSATAFQPPASSQQPVTPEQKQRVLTSLQTNATNGTTSTPLTPSQRQQVLQQVQSSSKSSAPQPSAEEKMKLLESLHAQTQ